MNVLLYSDLHAANIYSFNIKKQKYTISEYSRIDELYSTLSWICNAVKEYSIMMPINLGDTFHQALRFYVERLNTVNKAINTINQASLSKSGIVIEGNHDRTDDVSAVDIFENVAGTILVNSSIKVKFISEINSYFVFVPFIRDQAKVKKAFDELHEKFKKQKANIYIFCHLDIKEAYEGLVSSSYQLNQINSYDDLHLSTYKAIFSGHMHFRKKFKNNFYYVGTTLNHNFSDTFDRKGITLINFTATGYDTTFVENPFCPLFAKINIEKMESSLQKIKKIQEEKIKYPLTNVYCRIYSRNNDQSRTLASEFIEKWNHLFTAYETKSIDSDEDIETIVNSTKMDAVNVIDLIIEQGSKILEAQGKTKEEVELYVGRLKKICQLS